jgi:hypothetical protein
MDVRLVGEYVKEIISIFFRFETCTRLYYFVFNFYQINGG